MRGKPFQDIKNFSFRTLFSSRQLLLHNLSARTARRYSNLTHAVLRKGFKLEKFVYWRIMPSENVRKLEIFAKAVKFVKGMGYSRWSY